MVLIIFLDVVECRSYTSVGFGYCFLTRATGWVWISITYQLGIDLFETQ